MNTKNIRDIIKYYKQDFNLIHNKEIYKWHAVKRFQDHWNVEAVDFSKMLQTSLSLAKNLLDSGLYFPKRMLLQYAELEPEEVRKAFIELLNEDNDLIKRIDDFQFTLRTINKKYFPSKNDYQDHRAIIVYLCLAYPDRYYLYKFGMFKSFVQLVEHPYEPKRGEMQNLLEYLPLCDIVRAAIIKDNQLLELHSRRIGKDEYFDSSFNILTQDVIYAAVQHLRKLQPLTKQLAASNRLIKVQRTLIAKNEIATLKGTFTNYIENEKEKKIIGELGELLVFQYEQEKLKALNIQKEPEHKSKSEGDGLGYDILSYDEQGEEISIEVKTTAHGCDTPFYITRNELVKSTKEKENFRLYRLFEYNDETNTAKFYEQQGELTSLCNNPILYRSVVQTVLTE